MFLIHLLILLYYLQILIFLLLMFAYTIGSYLKMILELYKLFFVINCKIFNLFFQRLNEFLGIMLINFFALIN